MKCKQKLKKIHPSTFIYDYLHAFGIEDVDEFLNPHITNFEDCAAYCNIDSGSELLHKSLGDTVYLLVDCDLDGYCSSTIAYTYLTKLGCHIKPLFHKGKMHGLEPDIMQQIGDDCGLLWIPDAGSDNREQCEELVKRGVKILITDHHETSWQGGDDVIVINNQILPVRNINLSGAGVTYKLCKRYDEMYGYHYSDDLLDLVAVSIVGDVMDLSSLENRTFLHYGFRHIVNPFIKSVLTETTPEFISFSVAPLINAVIRSDNMQLKEDVFYAMVGLKEPDTVLKECKSAQRKQQNIVKKYTEQITADLDTTSKVLVAVTDINSSYTGLVASKISGMYNKPTLVLHSVDDNDILVGSARSPVQFRDVLNSSGLCIFANGHSEAFGTSLYKSNLEPLKQWLAQLEFNIESVYDVVYSLPASTLTSGIFTMCNNYNELFGQGLPKPQFHITNIRINAQDIELIGNNKTTIKWHANGVDYIKFFCGANVREQFFIGEDKTLVIEVIGTLGINEWCGTVTNQVIIDKFEVVEQKSDWHNIF